VILLGILQISGGWRGVFGGEIVVECVVKLVCGWALFQS
jgi:hypothetical protein